MNMKKILLKVDIFSLFECSKGLQRFRRRKNIRRPSAKKTKLSKSTEVTPEEDCCDGVKCSPIFDKSAEKTGRTVSGFMAAKVKGSSASGEVQEKVDIYEINVENESDFYKTLKQNSNISIKKVDNILQLFEKAARIDEQLNHNNEKRLRDFEDVLLKDETTNVQRYTVIQCTSKQEENQEVGKYFRNCPRVISVERKRHTIGNFPDIINNDKSTRSYGSDGNVPEYMKRWKIFDEYFRTLSVRSKEYEKRSTSLHFNKFTNKYSNKYYANSSNFRSDNIKSEFSLTFIQGYEEKHQDCQEKEKHSDNSTSSSVNQSKDQRENNSYFEIDENKRYSIRELIKFFEEISADASIRNGDSNGSLGRKIQRKKSFRRKSLPGNNKIGKKSISHQSNYHTLPKAYKSSSSLFLTNNKRKQNENSNMNFECFVESHHLSIQNIIQKFNNLLDEAAIVSTSNVQEEKADQAILNEFDRYLKKQALEILHLKERKKFLSDLNQKAEIYSRMVRITEELVRKRSEHNELMISTLEEISLHQEDIEKIEHIQNWCRDLKILYLQSNLISKLENLHKLKKLEYLNLAVNNIEKIENLEKLESLNKLDLTLNFIGELTSIETLACNYNLSELILTGNPCVEFSGYRDYVISVLPQLKSLDGTEITNSDRILATRNFNKIREKVIQAEIEYKIKRDEQKIRVQLKQEELALEMNEIEDENKRRELFWKSSSEHCPEVRYEMAKHHREAHYDRGAEEKKHREKCKRETIFFAPNDGRPYNINQPKLEFRLNNEPDHFELILYVYKFLDTSFIDIDVQPNYVRVKVKNKFFQLALNEEVKICETTSKRSQITGELQVIMPKLKVNDFSIRRPPKKYEKELENSTRQRQNKNGAENEEESYLKGTVNYKNIINNKSTTGEEYSATSDKSKKDDIDINEIPDLI